MATSFIDLTRLLCRTTTPPTIYPGDPTLHITPHATVKNDGYSVHTLHLGTHTSTHVDAPAHFVEGGRTIDEIALEELVGAALMVDLSGQGLKARQRVEWEDLEDAWRAEGIGRDEVSLGDAVDNGSYKMLLVHTGWKYPSDDTTPGISSSSSKDDAHFFDHPYFSSSIATRLLSPTSKVRLFGSDTPNPDETPFNGVGGADGYSFHEVFLGASRLIAENLTNLDKLVPFPEESSSGGTNGDQWVVSIIPLKIVGVDGSPVRAFASRQPSSIRSPSIPNATGPLLAR